MKGRATPYSSEELAWIKAHGHHPRKQAYAGFCDAFARSDVTLSNFTALCKRNGWLTGRTGRFRPGQEAYNKGKAIPFNANSARTQFKKGQVSHNYRGTGHERVDKNDGYIILIVDEQTPWTGGKTRPVHKHLYLWEQVHATLPDGIVLKCLDGVKTNTDPANWEAIPRAMLPRLNGIYGRGHDDADADVKPTIMAITKLEHAARTSRQIKRRKSDRSTS